MLNGSATTSASTVINGSATTGDLFLLCIKKKDWKYDEEIVWWQKLINVMTYVMNYDD